MNGRLVKWTRDEDRRILLAFRGTPTGPSSPATPTSIHNLYSHGSTNVNVNLTVVPVPSDDQLRALGIGKSPIEVRLLSNLF